jgi:hypothetical protein
LSAQRPGTETASPSCWSGGGLRDGCCCYCCCC